MRPRLAVVVAVLALTATSCFDLASGPEPQPAAKGARVGGVAKIGITAPISLDLGDADVHDRAGHLVMSTMCDPLLSLDPVTGEVLPGLVETWTIDDSGRVFNITLKRDLKFSDGSKVTAIDVAYSLTRSASQDQASPVAQLLSPIAGFDIVHGDVPAERAEQRETLSGVTVVSDRGLQITLKESRANFLYTLTHLALSPVPKVIGEKEPQRLRTDGICVGPYELEEPFKVGAQTIRLRRSETYFAGGSALTRGGRGYLDRIEFHIGDRPALEARYAKGELDATWLDPTLPTKVPAADIVRAPTGVIEYIGLPTGTAPFDQPEVRFAFGLALDRRQLIAAAFRDSAVPVASFVPPTMPDKITDGAQCDGILPTANVANARQILQKAGVSMTGKTIDLMFNEEHGNRALMTAAAAQWQSAFGVKTRLVGLSWEDYLKASRQPGFAAPFRYGWDAQVPDPDLFLDAIFNSRNTGAENVSKFDDPSFDQYLTRVARKQTDDDKRLISYGFLSTTLCRRMPMLPIAARTATIAVRRTVLGSAAEQPTDRASGQLLVRELYRHDVTEKS